MHKIPGLRSFCIREKGKIMKKEEKSRISYFQSNVTSIVSVSLVLILVGVIAFIYIIGNSMTKDLKESMGLTVVLDGKATEQDIAELDGRFRAAPYVSKVQFISKEAALAQWQEDTGENLLETFGVNPLSAEYRVNVKAAYANVAALQKIQGELKKVPCVGEVELYEAEVENVNQNLNRASIALSLVAALLIFISFVLINNTVRLTIYSRRFLIHTMKLVGAKPGFIRW